MKHYVFFDTNILLSLYKLKSSDIQKIDKHINYNNFQPVLTKLVIDEYYRNREKVLKNLFEEINLYNSTKVEFKKITKQLFSDIEGFNEFEEKSKEFNRIQSEFIKKFMNSVQNKSLTVDIFIQKIIEKAIIYKHDSKIIRNAKNKYDLGYPPGKGDRYCDMVTWQTLLHNLTKEKLETNKKRLFPATINKLYFCTNDLDYKNYHDYLTDEFEKVTKIKIEFIDFQHIINKIIPKLNEELKYAVNSINNSLKSVTFIDSKIFDFFNSSNNLATSLGQIVSNQNLQTLSLIQHVAPQISQLKTPPPEIINQMSRLARLANNMNE